MDKGDMEEKEPERGEGRSSKRVGARCDVRFHAKGRELRTGPRFRI